MKQLLLLGGFLLALSTTGQAQLRGVCGTPPLDAAEVARVQANKRYLRDHGLPTQRDVTYYGIAFHLIGENDGSGRADVSDVLDMLCYINDEFAEMDVQFFAKTFNYIDNTGAYNTPKNSGSLLNFNRDPNALNMYIANKADSGNSGPGTTLAYYDPQRDWVVTRIQEVNDEENTLAHEIGHFFSLPHPHRGWDSEPYNENDHGNPVQATSPGQVPTELQDGSNCETAGDMICDTPPDYNFGFGWPDCNFTDDIMDPSGEIVVPEERLHMGYFLNCEPLDEYFFSPMQKDLMLADMASPERAYIDTDHTPFEGEFDAPVLTSPAAAALVEGYNSVELQWDAVDGADMYLLRVSPVLTLNNSTNRIVYGTSRVIDDLDPGDVYYWQVKPLDGTRVCHDVTSEIRSFTTGTTVATAEVAELRDWSVAPNPAAPGTELRVQLEARATFTADVSLVDLTGRTVLTQPTATIGSGAHSLRVATDNLTPGVYFLTIRSNNGISRRRVVLQ